MTMTIDEALPMIIAETQAMIKDYDGKGIDDFNDTEVINHDQETIN